jgi:predicted amidohydrolase
MNSVYRLYAYINISPVNLTVLNTENRAKDNMKNESREDALS